MNIEELRVRYSQEKDGAGRGEDDNYLTVSTADCGGGKYFVIETERFSFDTIDELIEILNDFKQKACL